MAIWVSPIGMNDPDTAWDDETNAYDDDTSTYAATTEEDKVVGLTIAEMPCNKVRFYAAVGGSDPTVDLDVYYSSAWHNVFDDTLIADQWVEKSLGATYLVTKARLSFAAVSAWTGAKLYEFDFSLGLRQLEDFTGRDLADFTGRDLGDFTGRDLSF